MRVWFRRLHMYAGLLTASSVFVYGIVGITAMLEDAPALRHNPIPQVSFHDYVPPPNLSDVDLARNVLASFSIPMANPIPEWAIKHDKDNHLVLDYYTVNGMTRVTILEQERRLKFEATRVGFLDFLNRIHATTIRSEVPDLRVRGWVYYNELSIWAMLFMSLSGIYLWLSSRPQWGLAQLSFAAGVCLFASLYWSIR